MNAGGDTQEAGMSNSGDRPPRAWMRLPSGRRMDLISPAPDAWTDSDLAIRLGRTFRWGGESCWPRPLSVAQHSLTVLALAQANCRAIAGTSLPPSFALRELLHDAEEAFLGFDCIGPLKPVLGEPFRRLEKGLAAAVAARYRLPPANVGDASAHRLFDRVAAASEAYHVVGWSLEEIRDVLGIEDDVLETDPLFSESISSAIGTGKWAPWEPWDADVAADRFAMQLRLLLEERSAEGDELDRLMGSAS